MGTKPTFSDIEKLHKELLVPFYDIERDLAVLTKKRRKENDAEHSWSLAILACSLAVEIDPDLDLGKVCMFAIVHDVVEIYAGDTSVWSKAEHLQTKHEREKAAAEIIQDRFKAFPWIGQTIAEYERKDTAEAKFVWALDKFMNLLIIYVDKNRYNVEVHKSTKKKFDDLIKIHRAKAATHKTIAQYYDHMLAVFDKHPEYFYPESSDG